MALTVIREGVQTREVLLDWGIAEAEGILRWARAQGGTVDLAEKLVAGEPLSTEEEEAVAGMIGGWWRAMMIGYFVHHPTTWLEATLPAEDLGALRLNRWFLQDPKYGAARTMSELLASPGGGEYRIPNYDPARERGHVILVGTARDLPSLRLAEGTHRSGERMMRHRAGLNDGPAPVFVGICATAREWVPYDGDKPAANVPAGFGWWVD